MGSSSAALRSFTTAYPAVYPEPTARRSVSLAAPVSIVRREVDERTEPAGLRSIIGDTAGDSGCRSPSSVSAVPAGGRPPMHSSRHATGADR